MPNKTKRQYNENNKTSASATVHKGNNKKYVREVEEPKNRYYLIPVFIILCIIPFISHMKIYDTNLAVFPWYSTEDQKVDFFLYYKHGAFVIIAAIMAVASGIRTYINRKKLILQPILIPLACYTVLIILSTVFSDYITYSLRGGFEMFESVFALLGYCVVVYYIYLFFDSEKDFTYVYYFIIALSLVMGTIGLFQYFGMDIFRTELGKNILVPMELRAGYDIDFNFDSRTVYTTLYNPNYVGVFVALLIPINVVMLFFQKKIIPSIILIIALGELIICAIGSRSLTGLLGIGVAMFVYMILRWRILIKRFYITVPLIILFLGGLLFIDNLRDNYFSDKLINALEGNKVEYNIEDIHTEDDYVSLTYKGNELRVMINTNNEQQYNLYAVDSNNTAVDYTMDPATVIYNTADERFSSITMGYDSINPGAFFVNIDGVKWLFTYQFQEDTYYYINRFGKFDKIIEAPSALFTGNEEFATRRGYIWSRTIPMLKNYIFLGSGPDTYIMAYPQQDYFNLYQYGFGNQLLNKPHSLYLQVAVQTGCLSLIAFLVFYGIYFIASLRLYIKGVFTNIYAKLGVAVFISTISYMVAGLSNDSTVNTAPIFWTLMGIGIVLNIKAKSLINGD